MSKKINFYCFMVDADDTYEALQSWLGILARVDLVLSPLGFVFHTFFDSKMRLVFLIMQGLQFASLFDIFVRLKRMVPKDKK